MENTISINIRLFLVSRRQTLRLCGPSRRRMKSDVGWDQHVVLEDLDQRLRQGIVDLDRRAQLADNAAPLID